MKEAADIELRGGKGAAELRQEAEQLMLEAELATKEKSRRLEMRRLRRKASTASRDDGLLGFFYQTATTLFFLNTKFPFSIL